MPKGNVPKYKVIHCRASRCPHPVIKRFDRSKFSGWHVPAEPIIRATMRHRKKYHPVLFKASVRRGVATRKANR